MASINFLYRSKRPTSPLTLRLLFSHNKKNHDYFAITKIVVTEEYWKNFHKSNKKDIAIRNKQIEVNQALNEVEKFIFDKFYNTPIEKINKEWLINQIDIYYNPPIKEEDKEIELIPYIDQYIESKRNEITYSSIQKKIVQKNMLIRYQKHINKTLYITDVNSSFKNGFENYCIAELYSDNTIQRALSFFKTVCIDARGNGFQTNIQLDKIKIKYEKVDFIYLNFDELSQIENIESDLLNESLENAKDWLIISCYTGQRVSDFMRFTSEMIRTEDGKQLIEFTQKKTNKIMTIPLLPKVTEILNKRNGQFPKPLSEQKYNDYIKIVSKFAGLSQKVKGSKSVEHRKKEGIYEKWELVCSHIGRRSFATNFYGEIPVTYLKNVTGHSTEQMFLNYIGKSNKDMALEMAKYFK